MRALGPAERFVAGAVGEPGNRTFYLYVVANAVPHWLLAEKQQVAALAEHALQLLSEAGTATSAEAVHTIREHSTLPDPDEPAFRVGSMALRVGSPGGLVTVLVESEDEAEGIEFEVAPEQLHAMALEALEVVGRGRPICDLCRLPEDPEGHRCPSTNGHHVD